MIERGGQNCLANCPKCGTDVERPFKTWAIPSRKPLGEDEEPRLAGIFECTKCKARFRAAVSVKKRVQEAANIKNMVERIGGIKGELTQTLVNLREKIRTLETERATLMIEIDELRKAAETRVSALEEEVTALRIDAKSLQDLLGYQQEEEN
jgi:regulator of replication initiation timing